jgi:hypothetical protein
MFFWIFWIFLICRVLFFAECPKKVLGKGPFVDKIFVECKIALKMFFMFFGFS